jgi:hypothetical protein
MGIIAEKKQIAVERAISKRNEEIKLDSLNEVKTIKPLSSEEIKSIELDTETNFLKDLATHGTKSQLDEVFAEAIKNLPTEKYLIQKNEGVKDVDCNSYIDKIFSPEETFDVGAGAEYFVTNGVPTNILDESKFIPDRDEVSNPEDYTFFMNLTIGNEILQDKIGISKQKYVKYFLPGKLDEFIQNVRSTLSSRIDLKVNQARLELIRTIRNNVNTGTNGKVVTGTATNAIECITEFLNNLRPAFDANDTYIYDRTFAGYSFLNEENAVYIVHPNTLNGLRKIALTFLTKEGFTDFGKIDKFITLPIQIPNPNFNPNDAPLLPKFITTSDIVQENEILVLDRSCLKRFQNLTELNTEFYANNLMSVFYGAKRPGQGVLPICTAFLYKNPNLSKFVIPTQEVTAEVQTAQTQKTKVAKED